MTGRGIVILVVIALILLFWILDLVRRDRLYVGYGIIFILAILGAIPVGIFFTASALTLSALFFIVFMLIYVLTQVTIVSNRLALVVQEIAVQRAKEASQHGSDEK